MTEDIIAYQVDEEESKKLNFLRTKLLGLGAQELQQLRYFQLPLSIIFKQFEQKNRCELQKQIKVISTVWSVKFKNNLYMLTIKFYKNGSLLNFSGKYSKRELIKIVHYINNINLKNNYTISEECDSIKISYHLPKQFNIQRQIKKVIFKFIISSFIILSEVQETVAGDFKIQKSQKQYGDQLYGNYQDYHKENKESLIDTNCQDIELVHGKNKNIEIIKNVKKNEIKELCNKYKNKISYTKIQAEMVDTLNKRIPVQQVSQVREKPMILKQKKNEDQKFQADFQALSLKNIRNINLKCPYVGEYFLQIYDDDSTSRISELKVQPWVFCKYYGSKNLKDYFFELQYKEDYSKKVNTLCQICRALSYFKKHKLVHYDIKNENIMIDYSGIVKIIDYGCCSFLESEEVEEKLSITDECQKDTVVEEMKERMTIRNYHPKIGLQDIYHEKFDLYGLGKIVDEHFCRLKILETLKKFEQFNMKQMYEIKQNCWQKPSENKIQIQKILIFFQKVLQNVNIYERIKLIFEKL